MSKFFVEGNISDEQGDDNNEDKDNLNPNQPSYQYDFLDYKQSNAKRVVRTEKEKKWNAIKDYTIKIGNALNNQDFEKVWELLQELLREKDKSAKLIEKEGYPSFFLRCLKRVKDQIDEFGKNAEAKKKMKKHSATAFNTMSQKLKKIFPEYEQLIKQLLQKGEDEQESEEQQDEEQSSSEDEGDDITLLESPDPMVRRKYWLKKKEESDDDNEQQKKEEKKDEKKDEKKEEKKEEQKKAKKQTKEVKVPKKKAAAEIQSIKDAQNRMKDIKKNFFKSQNQEEREEFLNTLDKINETTKKAKDFEKLSFYLLDLPIRIDVCRQMKLNYFPRAQWLKLYNTIKEIHYLLRESEEDDLVENIRLFEDAALNKNDEAAKQVTEEAIYISLKTYLILIESELKKCLVFLDSNQLEYFERLQDLIRLVDLMYKISKEIQIKDGYEKQAAELAFKVLENAYFMDNRLIERIKLQLKTDVQFLELGSQGIIEQYANSVLKNRFDQETRIKTLLYLIYNHTINGREKGKELLIISTLSESILSQDYYTQVLYNRVLVQLGIMAFRRGNMHEVQQFLYEMCSIAKMKENTKDILKQFLAQGFSRFYVDKEIPKNKVLPVYLHLNVQMIESMQLVATMLLETPYILTEGGRITSKTLKKFIYQYERNFFVGERLNNRDLIYVASLSLKQGNWEECFSHLQELSIWGVLPDSDQIKVNLLRIVKEQALKCYLIGNRKCFKSIALSGLAEKFTLEEKDIRRHICKLISERILQGSITRSGYLVFVQKKQSEMQKICENFFQMVQDMTSASELWFNQKISAGYDSDEDKEEQVLSRRSNLAINEKLKAILSKRTEKF